MQTFKTKTTNPKSTPPANTKFDIPEISDLENKPFQTLINKVNSTIINGCKFNRKDRSGGSHTHQYVLDIEIHGEKQPFCLNLQPEGGKAKTYQIRQFIAILQFIHSLNQSEQLFNNTSNNYDALIESFKDQLLDSEANNISDVALSLHNLIQIINKNTEKLTLNNLTLINETLTNLVKIITANLNQLPSNEQEQILKEFIILLYKSDLVNLNKAQSKYFTIAPSLLQTINQIFKKDMENLTSIIGNEFNKEQNAVISIDNNYFVISTDLFGNILGLYQFAATTYPIDLEFNYQANDGVVKFCTLRAILQSQSDPISQLRQIAPEFQIEHFNHNFVQAHYLPLDPPHIEIKDGKSITYSRQFTYTDPQLPKLLLQKYHQNNIPLDNSTLAIANIFPPKPPKTQSKIECAKTPILIKKSVTKNQDKGLIVATIFTTYKSNSDQELYHFIQGKVPPQFNHCILEICGDITIIDLTQHNQLEQFKQLVNQFDWAQNYFYNKIAELLNLDLDVSTKLETIENLLSKDNLTNTTKFTLEIFKEMLEKIKQNPDISVDEEFIFNILSSTTNLNKAEFIPELDYNSSLKTSTKLVLMGCFGDIESILIIINTFKNMNDYTSAKIWIDRALKIDHNKKYTAFIYFTLTKITPDPILKKYYYETILAITNTHPSTLHSSYIYLLEILVESNEANHSEILALLENFNIFLRNNQEYMIQINQSSNEQIQNASAILNILLFLSEKLEPLRESQVELFKSFVPLLQNNGILEIPFTIYLIKIDIKTRNYDVAASRANDVYTDLYGKYKNHSKSAYLIDWLQSILLIYQSIPELENILIKVTKANIPQFQNVKEEDISAVLEQIKNRTTSSQPRNESDIKLAVSRLSFYQPDQEKNLSQLQQELENNIKNPDFKKCNPNLQAAAIIALVGSYCIIKPSKKKLQQLENKYLSKIDPSKISLELQMNMNMLKLRLYILQNQRQGFGELSLTINLDNVIQSIHQFVLLFAKVDFYLENSLTITNAKRNVIAEANLIKSELTEEAKKINFVEKCDIFLARKIGITEQNSITRVFKYIEDLRSANLTLEAQNDEEYFLMYEFSLWVLEKLQDSTYQNKLNTAYSKLDISETKNLRAYIEEIKKRCLDKFSDLGYRLMQIGICLADPNYDE